MCCSTFSANPSSSMPLSANCVDTGSGAEAQPFRTAGTEKRPLGRQPSSPLAKPINSRVRSSVLPARLREELAQAPPHSAPFRFRYSSKKALTFCALRPASGRPEGGLPPPSICAGSSVGEVVAARATVASRPSSSASDAAGGCSSLPGNMPLAACSSSSSSSSSSPPARKAPRRVTSNRLGWDITSTTASICCSPATLSSTTPMAPSVRTSEGEVEGSSATSASRPAWLPVRPLSRALASSPMSPSPALCSAPPQPPPPAAALALCRRRRAEARRAQCQRGRRSVWLSAVMASPRPGGKSGKHSGTAPSASAKPEVCAAAVPPRALCSR
mmetsp:Transcript_159255/g.510927  ORF Transcript_159255/g.510927 Transcript_159255/m.510927 type:complete len:330 (+) Transcript_159255:507-1496(+)